MQQKIENGTVNANRIDLQNYVVQLNTDDLIELAESGKTTGMYWNDEEGCHYPIEVELDDTAKIILHECLYMLKFEKKYYEKGKKKNAR